MGMRILIAEDDMASRKFLLKLLSQYGECDVVIDGLEALDAYLISIKDGNSYDLICLDIMMPKVDSVKVLKAIRELETQKGILPEKRSKIIIITVLAESKYVQNAFEIGCEAYVTKPVDAQKLIEVMGKLVFLE
jgi:two-component system chemotaxis response regulator CheY